MDRSTSANWEVHGSNLGTAKSIFGQMTCLYRGDSDFEEHPGHNCRERWTSNGVEWKELMSITHVNHFAAKKL